MATVKDTQFLADLAEKRAAWVATTRDNGFEDGITSVLAELYPDNAHCLYELLQNAEDAGASKVTFELTRNCLRFVHNGRDFTMEDVDGITGLGVSPEKTDVNQIGKFGVGFKAVFAYTSSPVVESDTYSFKIDNLVVPSLLEQAFSSRERRHTSFSFPFNTERKSASLAFEELSKGLEALTGDTLLFLQNIGAIQWRIEDLKEGKILLSERDLVCRVTQTHRDKKQDRMSEEVSDWLCLREPAKGAERLKIGLAFRLEAFDVEKVVHPASARAGQVAWWTSAYQRVSGFV